MKTYILTSNRVDDIIGWCAEELGDDGELVDVILSGKEWLALQHFGKDAAGTPNVDLDVVLLPCEHNLGRAVVARRDVASHLRILDTGQAEVANLQITVLIDENVGWLQVSVDDTGRVDVFKAALEV